MAKHTASEVAKWFLAHNRIVEDEEGEITKIIILCTGNFFSSDR